MSDADRMPHVNWPALVLTAGLGTRMRPLSLVRAKPAVPVAGVPLAGRVLRWLAECGVTDAVLNLHHKPESLTAAIGNGDAFGVRVRYSWEPEVLGSGGGPARARPLLDAPRFFIVNGDTLTRLDLQAMARQHVERHARVTLAVVPHPDPGHYGGVMTDDTGVVTRFSPRGADNTGWHFVGVQAVEAGVFDDVDPNRPSESVAGLYRAMVVSEPGSVQVYRCGATFHDIGTAADYLATCLTFADAEHRPESLVSRSCTVAADAALDRCVLWDRVTVGAGVALRECVVADDVVVPAGVRLARQALVRREGIDPAPHDLVIGDVLVTSLDTFRVKGESP
jgi:NDP-sugar pyrophosphorylase family protein